MSDFYSMDAATKVIVVLLVLIILSPVIFFSPIFTIWAVNNLFGTTLAVNVYNWMSVVWLQVIIGGLFRQAGRPLFSATKTE